MMVNRMDDICTDNRFELIEKFKKELIESTNIETSPEEMNVLDNILFRFWQMGWLDKLDSESLSGWIPCSERLPKENVYVLAWCGEVRIARIIRGVSKEQRAKMQEGAIDDPVSYGWNLSNGYFEVKRSESYRACDENGNNKVPYCWNCIYGEMFGQDVEAWTPLPEPYKEEGEQE